MTSSAFKHTLRLTASAVALALVAGCATPPSADDKEARAEWEANNDPLEPMNRAVFDFNQGADRLVIKPVAQGYREVVPEFGRDRVHDFLTNLQEPWNAVNSALQGNMEGAGESLGRFAMNTTFGVLGIMDVADDAGLPKRSEDFGQTLAVWGVGDGPYLVLPILGPSGARDAGGKVVDWYADPVSYYLREESIDWAKWTITITRGIDTRERYLDVLDDVERNSLDYYSSLRSLYRQRRDAEIRNSTKQDIPSPGMTSSADTSGTKSGLK